MVFMRLKETFNNIKDSWNSFFFDTSDKTKAHLPGRIASVSYFALCAVPPIGCAFNANLSDSNDVIAGVFISAMSASLAGFVFLFGVDRKNARSAAQVERYTPMN